MAPEVYKGQTVLKSDIWSLGITLIELAEGNNPYTGLTARKVMNKVCHEQSPSISLSKWSSEFVDFVGKCLVKDVNERCDTNQLMDVLD